MNNKEKTKEKSKKNREKAQEDIAAVLKLTKQSSFILYCDLPVSKKVFIQLAVLPNKIIENELQDRRDQFSIEYDDSFSSTTSTKVNRYNS